MKKKNFEICYPVPTFVFDKNYWMAAIQTAKSSHVRVVGLDFKWQDFSLAYLSLWTDYCKYVFSFGKLDTCPNLLDKKVPRFYRPLYIALKMMNLVNITHYSITDDKLLYIEYNFEECQPVKPALNILKTQAPCFVSYKRKERAVPDNSKEWKTQVFLENFVGKKMQPSYFKGDERTATVEEALDVLAYLNETCNKSFRSTKKNINFILQRLRYYEPASLKAVIDFKKLSWGRNTRMAEYLRPQTLFNKTNFENYIDEVDSRRALDISNPQTYKVEEF